MDEHKIKYICSKYYTHSNSIEPVIKKCKNSNILNSDFCYKEDDTKFISNGKHPPNKSKNKNNDLIDDCLSNEDKFNQFTKFKSLDKYNAIIYKKNHNNNDEFIEKHKENIQLNYIKDNLNNEYNENFYESILKEEPDKSDLSFSDNTKYNEQFCKIELSLAEKDKIIWSKYMLISEIDKKDDKFFESIFPKINNIFFEHY